MSISHHKDAHQEYIEVQHLCCLSVTLATNNNTCTTRTYEINQYQQHTTISTTCNNKIITIQRQLNEKAMIVLRGDTLFCVRRGWLRPISVLRV